MKLAIAGALVLLLAACTAFGSRPHQVQACLTISRFPSQVILAHYSLPEDGVFFLSFIHSVSQTPVLDHYQAIDWQITQTAETFQAHGAGLPSGTDEPGATDWEHQDGRFVIRMQRSIPRLIVRTDRNYCNRLYLGGREINLNAWEDQALELAIAPCTVP